METSRGMKLFGFVATIVVLLFAVMYYRNEVPNYAIDDMQVAISVDQERNCAVQEHVKAVTNGLVEHVYYLFPVFSVLTDSDGNKILQYNRILESCFDEVEGKGFGVGNRNMRVYILNGTKYKGDYELDFSYVMKAAEINREDASSVLLNLVSADNRVQINGISFSVELPSEIKQENVHFYLVDHDRYMTEITPEYRVHDRVLTGKYTKSIEPGTGVAIRVSAQDEVFHTVMTEREKRCIGLTILLSVVGFLIWFFFGRAKYPVIETVEFSPPFGLNCLEMSWIYNGFIRQEDVLAMFLYMAGKGYVRAQKRYSYRKRKSEYVFFFEKKYDGDNEIEEKFMSFMFPGKKCVVYEEDLHYGDGGCLDQFMDWISPLYNSKGVFSKGCNRGEKVLILFVFVLIIANYIVCFDPIFIGKLSYYFQMMMQILCVAGLIGFFALIPMIFRGKKGALLKAVAYGGLAVALIVWYPLFVYATITQFLLRFVLPFAAIILMIWFIKHMNRRNEAAAMAMGRILGYCKFLQNVEKARIEILMNDNPDFFFTVFSYTYVLNVSWKWLLDLENIVFPVREENELF